MLIMRVVQRSRLRSPESLLMPLEISALLWKSGPHSVFLARLIVGLRHIRAVSLVIFCLFASWFLRKQFPDSCHEAAASMVEFWRQGLDLVQFIHPPHLCLSDFLLLSRGNIGHDGCQAQLCVFHFGLVLRPAQISCFLQNDLLCTLLWL